MSLRLNTIVSGQWGTGCYCCCCCCFLNVNSIIVSKSIWVTFISLFTDFLLSPSAHGAVINWFLIHHSWLQHKHSDLYIRMYLVLFLLQVPFAWQWVNTELFPLIRYPVSQVISTTVPYTAALLLKLPTSGFRSLGHLTAAKKLQWWQHQHKIMVKMLRCASLEHK